MTQSRKFGLRKSLTRLNRPDSRRKSRQVNSVPAAFYFLPLLAGFVLLKDTELSRYELVRHSGHQLYFRVAFWGFIVALSSFVLLLLLIKSIEFVSCNGSRQDLRTMTQFLADHHMLLSLSLSPLLGWIIPRPVNFIADEYKWLWKALEKNELEKLLAIAVMRDSLIMLSLKNEKVYCGYISNTPDPSFGEKRYIDLIPVISGYRDSEHRVVFTTKYDEALNGYSGNLEHLDEDSLVVVIPIREVVSARMFDAEAYAAFNEHAETTQAD